MHTEEHVRRIQAGSALPKGGDAGDRISPFGRGGSEIALLAAGGCLEALDAVLDGRVDNAYALVRPPGHHALPGRPDRPARRDDAAPARRGRRGPCGCRPAAR